MQTAGTFKRQKDAEKRRDLVAGWIAGGQNPAERLQELSRETVYRSLEAVGRAYADSRVDAAAETKRSIENALNRINPTLGAMDPHAVTPAIVAEWVAGLGARQATARRYLQVLKPVLDHAGVDPNPARDARVKLPREERGLVEPPSAAEVAAMVANVAKRHRLVVQVLAATGMRVGEACDLEWRDVDLARSRFRVRGGKTPSTRRWVSVPPDVLDELAATPSDERSGRVFPLATPGALRSALERACKNAGISRYHPHDLRHRFISVQLAKGIPVANVAAQVGHARQSLTWDSYSHVLLAE